MLSLSACGTAVSCTENIESYVKTLDYHDDYTILQITDIHWSNGSNPEYVENYIEKVINEVENHAGNIDLIEVTGDTFMLSNKSAVKEFISFMAKFNIPYAIIWGNHDMQCQYSANWLSKQFENAPNCLYTEVDNDDVTGRSNYAINLMQNGKAVWQIINLDTGASYKEGALTMFWDYDFLRQDQLDFVDAVHQSAGDDVPALCYYHICQAEYQKMYDDAENTNGKYFNLEGFSESETPADDFETMKRNNVKGVFAGHAHNTDWTGTKDGIVYGLGVKTGTELYYTNTAENTEDVGFEMSEDMDIIGASLVTLKNTDGEFTLEHLYLNEGETADKVLWVNYND